MSENNPDIETINKAKGFASATKGRKPRIDASKATVPEPQKDLQFYVSNCYELLERSKLYGVVALLDMDESDELIDHLLLAKTQVF